MLSGLFERIAAQFIVRLLSSLTPEGWFARWRLRAASGRKVTLLVALLDNEDAAGTVQRSIADAVNSELSDSVDVYLWPRALKLEHGPGDLAESKAKKTALRWLKKTNCDLLIWGRVKSNGVLSLRFTPAENYEMPQTYLLTSGTLELPALFVSRLGAAIAAHVASSVKAVVEASNQLLAPLQKLANRLDAITKRQIDGFDPATLGSLMHSYALVRVSLFDALGNIDDLRMSIALNREAILNRPRSELPDAWSNSQNNLGTALARLASNTSDEVLFAEAIDALKASLEERPPEKSLIRWTGTQINLANVRTGLGIQKDRRDELLNADFIYDLIICTELHEADPRLWAGAQNNRALTLIASAIQEAGLETLRRAQEALTEALEVIKLDERPLNWAAIKSNLGTVLLNMADRDQVLGTYEAATEQFSDALKVYSRRQFPMKWAPVQNNLGLALSFVGFHKSSTKLIRRGITALRAALAVYDEKSLGTRDWRIARVNLGRALMFLGDRDEGHEAKAAYDESIAVMREALAEVSPMSPEWQSTMQVMALVLQKRGFLTEARAKFELLLTTLTPDTAPIEWLVAMSSLGVTLRALGTQKNDVELLTDAVDCFRQITDVFSPTSNRVRWVQGHLEMAKTYAALAVQTADTKYTDLCHEECREVLEVFAGETPAEIAAEIQKIYLQVDEEERHC
jgi:tetratricopeptide (TPR) repeat protein